MERTIMSRIMEQEYAFSRITKARFGKKPDKVYRFTM
jgi:hypothetical protein